MENNIREMLYTYALGCLEKKEYQLFQSYISSADDFPWKELGDYQNLAALLPLVLDIESPDPKLKDKVARKLYKLKGDFKIKPEEKIPSAQEKEKIINIDKEEVKRPVSPRYEVYNPLSDEGFEEVPPKNKTIEENYKVEESKITNSSEENYNAEEEKILDNNKEDSIPKSEPVKEFIQEKFIEHNLEELNPSEFSSISSQKEIEPTKFQKEESEELKPLLESYHPKQEISKKRNTHDIINEEDSFYGKSKKKNTGFKAAIIFFFLSIAAIIVMYFIFSDAFSKTKSELEQLRKEVNELKNSAGKNQPILDILDAQNVIVINLKAADSSMYSFGKILIDPGSKKAFIKLVDMPGIDQNKTFQLWAAYSGNYTSLGLYNPSQKDYISFSPGNLPARELQFIVSEERLGGSSSNRPEGRIILASGI